MVTRALSLFSGSLASRLATRVVERSPGVDEVYLLHFRSPFFEEYREIRDLVKGEWPGLVFRTQSLKKEYRHLACGQPEAGGFSLSRSCRACRRILLGRAARYMRRVGAQFLVTGEVVGQNGLFEDDLLAIVEELGIADLVLRPLSARLLRPTLPEREGWVESSWLSDLTAAEPERLAALALGLGFPADPRMDFAARCKLSIPGFGERLEGLLEETGVTMNALKLLDFPLYFTRPPDVKIVLARTAGEKRALQNLFLPNDLRVYLSTHPGPMALVRTAWDGKAQVETRDIVELAARLTVAHSEASHLSSVQVSYRLENDSETSQLTVLLLPASSREEVALVSPSHLPELRLARP